MEKISIRLPDHLIKFIDEFDSRSEIIRHILEQYRNEIIYLEQKKKK